MAIRTAMLLSNSFRPDPRVLKEAKGLAQHGHHVSIICWDRANDMPPYESPSAGIEVLRIQNVPSAYGVGIGQITRLLRFWLAAFPLLDKIKPDLVHCHDFDTLPAGLLWGKVHRTPVIYDAHEYYADLVRPRLQSVIGNILYRLIARSERLGARLSTAIITVDETLAAAYSEQNARVVIIGHYPEKSLAQFPAPLFTHPQLHLLYMGRLSTDRGVLTYLDLLRMLHQAGIPARLSLAGVFTPPSEEIAMQSTLSGLEDSVDLLGWIPYEKIPSLLQSCDVGLCILSPEERYIKALPVKLFEYMAGGLPVIASNFPAIARIVDNVRCGVLVNPDDDASNLVPILDAWRKNPAIARQLGENGRRVILEKYNWEILVSRLDDLYRSIVPRA